MPNLARREEALLMYAIAAVPGFPALQSIDRDLGSEPNVDLLTTISSQNCTVIREPLRLHTS